MIAERYDDSWETASLRPSAKKRILLADDQESIRKLVGATLGGEQFDLIYAADGEEALRLAIDLQPDLVLLDVEMPRLNGYDVCRALKQRSGTAGVRVMMLTALARDEDQERGRSAGADDYIVKPFSPLMLLKKVQSLLGEGAIVPREGSPSVVAVPGANPGIVIAAEILSASVEGLTVVDRHSVTEQIGGLGVQRGLYPPIPPKTPVEAKLHELEVSQRQLLIYAEELNQAYRELQSTYFSTLQALAAAIDARDPYTYGHSQRVAAYAVEIGRMMGLDSDALEIIRRAGLLHDIGKIGVPDGVLRKPGRLNDEEWEQIKRHPDVGFQMVSGLRFLVQAAPFIRCHHERWDGRGYPQALRGEGIPLGARILAVADSFDAMTSTRPYRPALSIESARTEAEACRHTQFDTHVVDAFQAAILPIGEILDRESGRG